jgi:hypothetical protein
MDAASGVLAMLGLAYCLSRIRCMAYRFLVLWWAVALTATGLSHIHDQVAFSRLQIVLPAMATFAGIAVDRILTVVDGVSPLERLKPLVGGASLAVLVPLVFSLNVQRFWVDSAHHSATSHPTVAVRAVMEGQCAANGPANAIVSENSAPAMDHIFNVFGLTDDRPTSIGYGEVFSGEASDKMAAARCVVLMDTNGLSAEILAAELRIDRPNWRIGELTDLSGINWILVAGPPGPE